MVTIYKLTLEDKRLHNLWMDKQYFLSYFIIDLNEMILLKWFENNSTILSIIFLCNNQIYTKSCLQHIMTLPCESSEYVMYEICAKFNELPHRTWDERT